MFKIFPNQIAMINVATFVWIEVKVDIKLWKVSSKDTKLREKTVHVVHAGKILEQWHFRVFTNICDVISCGQSYWLVNGKRPPASRPVIQVLCACCTVSCPSISEKDTV